jgi:ribonuclease HI
VPVFYVDGQSIGNEQKGQPRKARIAIAFKEEPDSDFKLHWRDIGDKTNNEAEYHALLKALSIIDSKWLSPNKGKLPQTTGPFRIYSDSELMVKQVNGKYEVKDAKLRDLWSEVSELRKKVGHVSVEWIPREENYAGQWLEGSWKGGKVTVIREKS